MASNIHAIEQTFDFHTGPHLRRGVLYTHSKTFTNLLRPCFNETVRERRDEPPEHVGQRAPDGGARARESTVLGIVLGRPLVRPAARERKKVPDAHGGHRRAGGRGLPRAGHGYIWGHRFPGLG